MKTTLLLLAGISLGLASLLLSRPTIAARSARKASGSLDELGHRLQDAWADHHTVA